ncbi:MAG: agmatinase [Vicinamibacterales bacterium]|jgi:agmatinase|nr:agmatinase [Acidobacteriota bacterium]MDP6373227.1 agmatinase [Vicinamibacterales bacterium]MDP6608477.1 agmatinase [Vicinamibacterales bacterium]HAK56287.1 agmatinase [Acidobacteriota bacterium]|tara:strand:+ start:1783 stop:2670 length:888 start_codon:yes stop_codon:yes gene_type:complete
MTSPPRYAQGATRPFGDVVGASFDDAAAVILPAPLERTTSYVQGTRQGPAAILQASAQLELWDEELGVEVHGRGLCTLPEMELPFDALADALAEIQRVADGIVRANKFLVTLGGEHSITPPLVAATAAHHEGLSVLQIDAHADLRDEYLGERNSHACAIRRALAYAPCTQVGIRSLSTEEAATVESLPTMIFYDAEMRARPTWMNDVVETLQAKVYITIDCDGLDPAVMPAVGTPEPGGLGWRELLELLRLTFRSRDVVGCDVVELCPIPGQVHPNFLCAKLVYKLLTYRLADAH